MTATATNKIDTYILSEGDVDAERLDLQHELFQVHLNDAFDIAAELRNLDGATVVDYGSGASSAHDTVMQYTKNKGKYVGVDSSQQQIDWCKKKYPNASYIYGNEQDIKVAQQLSNADLVLMRFVAMHQTDPRAFLTKIYNNLKPGTVLIVQDMACDPGRRKMMTDKYPQIAMLYNMKERLAKGLGLDYDFSLKAHSIFESLKPNNVIYSVGHTRVPMTKMKILYEQFIDNIAGKAISKNIMDERDIKMAHDVVAGLPSDEDHYWYAEQLTTFIVQK